MKKWLLFLMIFLALPALPARAAGQAEAVYDVWSGEFLYEKNADAPMKIASTTKLMTALAAAEELDPDGIVEIAPEHTAIEGSKMYLRAGEKRTVRELLCGLLLASGNDAALALADAAGGEAAFVRLMNEKAEELGCRGCLFENPAGLDGQDHHATARDLALIAEAAYENDLLRGILRTRYASFDGHDLKNHNKLLWKSGACVGGKTGYTKAAGRCLVSVFEKDGRPIIIVTLDDPDDWNDHLSLYETYTEELRMTAIRLTAALPVVNGKENSAETEAAVSLPLRAGERKKITARLYAEHFFYAMPPVGTRIGEFELRIGEKPVWKGEALRVSRLSYQSRIPG